MDRKVLIGIGVMMLAAMAASFDPIKDAKMVIVNNCKTKVGASEEDLKIVLDHGLPSTDNGLCLVECLLTQGNMMKNGKLNVNGFLASAKREKKYTPEQVQKLEQLVSECDKEINASNVNGCQAAKKIVDCTTTKGKEIEFKFPSRL
ncbi:general odorant-binding protein 19d-like [Photinus pyralis]|uniref:general odorant-binding protein 19d-like n=1 Tax=Photinus pyralis TaxID=7054 RepID=UPI0012672951|nr:general odorant-binding protein 19d-like [Photinus pyralis]